MYDGSSKDGLGPTKHFHYRSLTPQCWVQELSRRVSIAREDPTRRRSTHEHAGVIAFPTDVKPIAGDKLGR